MKEFHEWLVMRKERGDNMPETREELMQIYKVERPKFLMPNQHKKSYSQKQLKFSTRRHYT
jgi:predicted ATP-binding protein involved in virulence